jgi:hypothetical protein
MTGFFDHLRNPGKSSAPVELDDLAKQVAALSAELAVAWDASIFRPDKRDELLEVVSAAVYDHIAIEPPDPAPVMSMIRDIVTAEPLLHARPGSTTGLDYKALLAERARLLRLRSTLADPRLALDCLVETLGAVFGMVFVGLPSVSDGIQFATQLSDTKSDRNASMRSMRYCPGSSNLLPNTICFPHGAGSSAPMPIASPALRKTHRRRILIAATSLPANKRPPRHN